MTNNAKHLLVCETCDETYCMDCSDGDPGWRYCSRRCTETPDMFCLTMPDGECVSDDPRCMHRKGL